VRAQLGDATVVATSVVAYAEAPAAFARTYLERGLTPRHFRIVKQEFERGWPTFLALETTASLARWAGELAERYRLRGFDSIHLTSFAEVAHRSGVAETRFSSFDERLNNAARRLTRALLRRP
jgi:hypothetical protein